MLKRVIFFNLLIFLSANFTFAQKSNDKKFPFEDWEEDYDVWNWYSASKPFMELNYGIGQPKNKIMNSEYSKVGQIDIRFGFSEKDIIYSKSIIEFNEKFLLFSYFSHDLQKRDTDFSGKLKSTSSRFGFGYRDGLGYKVGILSIIPFSSTGYSWTRLDVKDFPDANNYNDVEAVNRYNKSFRFGDFTEGGIRIGIGPMVALNASYEAAIIYPRHVFWPWFGSAIIQNGGRGIIDWFVDEIFDSSPSAAPVMEFVMKNAWNYVYYGLKRDKMNFPFNSETPLSYETIKLGLTFTF